MTAVTQDPFASIKEATVAHQRSHRCGSHPFDDGPQLTAWAAGVEARTVVELGTSLGYSAACFAAAGARVHTVDRDPVHVDEARRLLKDHKLSRRVDCRVGEGVGVLATLPANSADVAFFDGMEPSLAEIDVLIRSLRPGGLLIASNMTLGGEAAEVRELLATWQHTDLGLNLLAIKPEKA
ncbi:O-methyltransferase [Streptomyces noursei]|uniref:O-methyltransferase n=1 Tax=Streptomyces noursei TaxID=1971 RepID=UPI0033DFB8F3